MMGRSGSSMAGKNKAPVLDLPLLAWGMRFARSVSEIEHFFLTSDDETLLEVGKAEGYLPIRRPSELGLDTASGCDVLSHAITEIEKKVRLRERDVVLMQHANSASYSPAEIHQTLSMMREEPTLDCVAPAHRVEDHHPFRQKRLLEDGSVESFFPLPRGTSTNRQELPASVAFNHSFWAVRVKAIRDNDGEPPWSCMGPRVKVILTDPRTDVHSESDLVATEKWIVSSIPDWREIASDHERDSV